MSDVWEQIGLTLPQVELIRNALQQFPAICSATLFGSRAKGSARPNSDVDLAITGVEDSLLVEQISDQLDALPLPFQFDLQAQEKISNLALKAHIDRVGILLYQNRILHHGAVDGVTGSCHQLFWSGERSILIDCGLFQGDEVASDGSDFEQMKIRFPVDSIDALVVTHVHIDHVGRIPYLLAAGFKGPIYCSEPSAKLLPLVLEDALKIGFTRNQQLIEHFLKQIKKQIHPLSYKQWKTIEQLPPPSSTQTTGIKGRVGEGVEMQGRLRIKLQPAGHILGSAYVEFDLKTDTTRERITFSGDLGAPYSPLIRAPRSPYRSDCLVLESTYGDKLHHGRRDRRNQLKRVIQRAIQNRGVILIPAFSIGRTQELLYELETLIHRQEVDLEVVVDSPLAAQFTETYRALKPYWDREAKRRLKQGRHPLAFEQLWTIDDHQTHLQTVEYLKKSAKPTIVIVASGMCSGGRIVNYLKGLIGDPRTDILFVGYQANGTPGRTIQKYGSRGGWVALEGKRYTIQAKVWTISGYSAHADQNNLINFIKRMRHKPKEVRLVHGDQTAKKSLKERLEKMLPESSIRIP